MTVDEADLPETIFVVVQWNSDGDSKFLKISLDASAKSWTLKHFKDHVAQLFAVKDLQLPDFNEEMDEMTLNDLSIGQSNVPILLDLAEGATPATVGTAGPLTEAPVVVEEESEAAPEVEVADVGPAVPKGPPSFATKKALEDASEVKDGWLFLSGQLAASNLGCLQRLGITHVLNCCERIPCKFKGRLKYKVIPVMDTKSSDIRAYIPDAVEFIDEVLAGNGKVLVHCMVGASRSVSLVLAWLVAHCRIPLKQAFQLVRSKRHQARPNRSFCEQLMNFEEETLGSKSATLADFFHK
eukprot:symbB.v1.2.025730.t1/scaffold2516.1/size77141/5